jgi:hypothetical protein
MGFCLLYTSLSDAGLLFGRESVGYMGKINGERFHGVFTDGRLGSSLYGGWNFQHIGDGCHICHDAQCLENVPYCAGLDIWSHYLLFIWTRRPWRGVDNPQLLCDLAGLWNNDGRNTPLLQDLEEALYSPTFIAYDGSSFSSTQIFACLGSELKNSEVPSNIIVMETLEKRLLASKNIMQYSLVPLAINWVSSNLNT